jgi:hypothetical protein
MPMVDSYASAEHANVNDPFNPFLLPGKRVPFTGRKNIREEICNCKLLSSQELNVSSQ